MVRNLKNALKVSFIAVIEILFCFTPLGTIPIGPIVATLSMIPVIISSLTFGKKIGMLMGFVFGLCSFIYWTFIMPAFPTAFLFTPFSEVASYKGNLGSLIICFVPRILAGLTPFLVLEMFKVADRNNFSAKVDIIASVVGSMTNTALVLLLIFIFFGREYSDLAGKSLIAVLETTIISNGLPEAVMCAIVCPIVTKVLRNI